MTVSWGGFVGRGNSESFPVFPLRDLPTTTTMEALQLDPSSSALDRGLYRLRNAIQEAFHPDNAVPKPDLKHKEVTMANDNTSIDSLSNEVLHEIFTYAISDAPTHDATSSTHPARILSQVSQRWRKVALTSPPMGTGLALHDGSRAVLS